MKKERKILKGYREVFPGTYEISVNKHGIQEGLTTYYHPNKILDFQMTHKESIFHGLEIKFKYENNI